MSKVVLLENCHLINTSVGESSVVWQKCRKEDYSNVKPCSCKSYFWAEPCLHKINWKSNSINKIHKQFFLQHFSLCDISLSWFGVCRMIFLQAHNTRFLRNNNSRFSKTIWNFSHVEQIYFNKHPLLFCKFWHNSPWTKSKLDPNCDAWHEGLFLHSYVKIIWRSRNASLSDICVFSQFLVLTNVLLVKNKFFQTKMDSCWDPLSFNSYLTNINNNFCISLYESSYNAFFQYSAFT